MKKASNDICYASRKHPQSEELPLNQVPMFISLGFDDNGISDAKNNGAASWIRNFLKDRRNPIGTGNELTFDGHPQRASFYLCAKYAREEVYESNNEIIKIWTALREDGNELGSHSTVHLMEWDSINEVCINYDGTKYSSQEWLDNEIRECQAILTSKEVGIPQSELKGWRTPRLEWNNDLFSVLIDEGFIYDCSIESNPDNDGLTEYWPFTLDNGHPEHRNVGSFPGLWEMPAYCYHIPEKLQERCENKATITGLDFNVLARKDWGGFALSGDEYTEILKHTLDLRMKGNRAPMLVGFHSDFYADLKNDDFNGTKNARERQLAIENFLDYAIETYPEAVRVVPTKSVISWMREPSPLGL